MPVRWTIRPRMCFYCWRSSQPRGKHPDVWRSSPRQSKDSLWVKFVLQFCHYLLCNKKITCRPLYITLNNFPIGDKRSCFLHSFSVAFAFKCPILHFGMERWGIKTCFRPLFAILCFQMLICYIQTSFGLGGIQSCFCSLYNLGIWLKNPHFYSLYYVDGHFNVTSVKHKLNFTNKVC